MKTVLVALFSLALVACSGMGLESPSSDKQRLVYSEAHLASLANEVKVLREAGEIPDDTFADLVEKVKEADRILDGAWLALDAGEDIASKLETVQKILVTIQEDVENADG